MKEQGAVLKEMGAVLKGQGAILKEQGAILKEQGAILKEMRRDNAYTRNLWILAARKLNLLDELPDED